MKLRLTDGFEYDLQSCIRENHPELNKNLLICNLGPNYEFDDVIEEFKKDQIAEILSIFNEEGNYLFQSNDYPKIASITNDIKSNKIIVTFSNK